jgi:hypothetical protein
MILKSKTEVRTHWFWQFTNAEGQEYRSQHFEKPEDAEEAQRENYLGWHLDKTPCSVCGER